MGKGPAFGASSPGLWGLVDPVGYSLRMSVLSALEELTGSALTWRLKDTPSGRLWWVLGRSEPRTEGSESGSWPTAHGMDNDGNPRRNGPTGCELGRAVTKDWSTAQAQDSKQNGDDPRSAARMLISEVRRSWTTPTQDDAGGRSKRYKQGGTSLSAQMADSAKPSPRSCTAMQATVNPDAKFPNLETIVARTEWACVTSHPRTHSPRRVDHGMRLANQVAGLPAPESPSTSGKSRDWPTAQAMDVLPQRGPEALARAKGKGGCANLREHPAVGRGVLNSRWVAQLMGYPSDWLAVGTERLSRLWATRSSARLSRSSAKPSSKRMRSSRNE